MNWQSREGWSEAFYWGFHGLAVYILDIGGDNGEWYRLYGVAIGPLDIYVNNPFRGKR